MMPTTQNDNTQLDGWIDFNDFASIRLPEYNVRMIIDAFQKNFTPSDHLWIFGSRVVLSKRGGDIDLYIETPDVESYSKRIRFAVDIEKKIGEQKIDIVINCLGKGDLLIHKVARENGIRLS